MKDLTPLLSEPGTSIAVVGATDHRGKYGGIIYRDMKSKGYPVFAVNPNRSTVDGDRCWPTVKDLPEKPTIVTLVVHAEDGLDVLEDCAEAGLRNVWVQPGASSPELIETLEQGDFEWLADACVMVRSRASAPTSDIGEH